MRNKLNKHNGLMTEMASSAGVDLGRALIEGRVDASQYRYSVIRCSRCRNVESCETQLAAGQGETGPVPEFCANKGLFQVMALSDH